MSKIGLTSQEPTRLGLGSEESCIGLDYQPTQVIDGAWGKITGDIENQKDLVRYIDDRNHEAIAAADRANTAAAAAEQAVADVQEAIASQSLGIPNRMTVDYPQHLTVGNKEDNKIVATLYPLATALQNVLFLADNNAVSVYPDGSIHINKAGRSVVHVVPTLNTALYRTLLITVSDPSVRLVTKSSVRLLAGGTFRLT